MDFFSILERFVLEKPLQNGRSWVCFFDLVESMREVWFWTTLHRFCNIFQLWKHQFSSLNWIFFSYFSMAISRLTFYRFGNEIWSMLEAKWALESIQKSIKNEVDFQMIFLMDFRSHRRLPDGKYRGGLRVTDLLWGLGTTVPQIARPQ